MPHVNGILETAIYADDLQRSATFYRELFGFETLQKSERLIALEVAGRNVLLIFKAGATHQPFTTPGGTIPAHGGSGTTHFAFSIDAKDLASWRQHLESAGVPVESVVEWPNGAESLYFRDPDQHLVELITRGFWRIY